MLKKTFLVYRTRITWRCEHCLPTKLHLSSAANATLFHNPTAAPLLKFNINQRVKLQPISYLHFNSWKLLPVVWTLFAVNVGQTDGGTVSFYCQLLGNICQRFADIAAARWLLAQSLKIVKNAQQNLLTTVLSPCTITKYIFLQT